MQTFTNAASLIEGYAVTGVTVPAGIYELERTVELAAGSRLLMPGDCILRPVAGTMTGTMVSVTKSDVRIIGGCIQGYAPAVFTEAEDGTWVCDWSAWNVGDLFKDDVRVPPCQWPDGTWCCADSRYTDSSVFDQEDVPDHDPSEWQQVTHYGTNHWVTLFTQSVYHHNNIAFKTTPSRILNNRATLVPGTFCHDYVAGQIVYMPLAGEQLSVVQLCVPQSVLLLEVKGLFGARLTGIVVNGVRFIGSRGDWVNREVGDGGIGYTNYMFSHTYATGTEVSECLFHYSGCNGVYVSGSNGFSFHHNKLVYCSALPFMMTGSPDAVVELNRFLSSGGLMPSAYLACFYGGASENAVLRRNELAYGGYSAFNHGSGLVGQVVDNHIHHVMRRLSDGGGIYSIGPNPVARDYLWARNYFHDIIPDATHLVSSFGIYFDNLLYRITTEDNLFERCQPRPINNQYNTEGNIGFRDKFYFSVEPSIPWLVAAWDSYNATYPRTTYKRLIDHMGTVTGSPGSQKVKLYFPIDCMTRYQLTGVPWTVIQKTTYGGKDALYVETSKWDSSDWKNGCKMNSSWPCLNVLDTGYVSDPATACNSIVNDWSYASNLFGDADDDTVGVSLRGIPTDTKVTIGYLSGDGSGLSQTDYYVRDIGTHDFKLSLSPGGSVEDITADYSYIYLVESSGVGEPRTFEMSGEADDDKLTLLPQPIVDGKRVLLTFLSDDGSGLSLAYYYVRDTTTHTFKLSLTLGGAVVNIGADYNQISLRVASKNIYMVYPTLGTTDPVYVNAVPGDLVYYPMVPYSWYYAAKDRWYVSVEKDAGDMTEDIWFKSSDFGISSPWDGTFWIEIAEDALLNGVGRMGEILVGDPVRIMVHHDRDAEKLDEPGMTAAATEWMRRNPDPDTPKTESLQPLQSWFDHPKNSAAMLLHL